MRMGTEVKKKSGLDLTRAFGLLRDAKSLLNECRLDNDADPDFLKKSEDMIIEAQREVILAGEALDAEFLEKWNDVFGRIVRGETIWEFPISKPSFYPNMPRGKWVKIAPLKGLKVKKLRDVARKYGVEIEPREGDYLLIGDEQNLRSAMEEIRMFMKVKQ